MPYDDPSSTDPMMLVGVELPGSLDDERERTWVFCEEFARLGFSEERILQLFRNPTYAGAHRAFLALGEIEVAAMIRETCAVWGAVRRTTTEPKAPAVDAGPRRLPVRQNREEQR